MTSQNKADIYYLSLKNVSGEFYSKFLFGINNITMNEIISYYVKIYTDNIPNTVDINNDKSVYDFLESSFQKFNDPDCNPLTSQEFQNTIIMNKLHTSMSIGDIIVVAGNYYCVSGEGFNKILF